MAIPDFQSIMLPLLKRAGDRKVHSFRDTVLALADQFGLTDAEREELLPSGRQPTFDNRVGWARTYMKKAGLLTSPSRGNVQITERGIRVLKENPSQIDTAYLRQFSEFLDFQKPKPKDMQGAEPDGGSTPEEEIETVYLSLREGLADDVLDAVRGSSPTFFERLVIDLLVRMGYGGTRKEAGQAVGRSGDGGIDGIINEDRLGLDVVYMQAKRWEHTVGRPEIQKFAGALQGQRARKGVFITTSEFSKAARDYVSKIDSKIVLIDGDTLAELMIDFDIGVTGVATYELKRVDSDYFVEE
ncbi:restriction endonuclease [Chloroflexota bacterium]